MAKPERGEQAAASRLDGAFQQFLELREQGDSVDAKTLGRDFPDVAVEMARVMNDYESLERLFGDSLDDLIPAFLPTPGSFGKYDLLDVIGYGGMGVVYLARDLELNRRVAIKVLRDDKLKRFTAEQRRRWLRRFHTEAAAAAQLEHDHLVTIYEHGEIEGRHYYAMQFVDGCSLADLIAERAGKGVVAFAPQQAARYVEQAARGVAAAHQAETPVLHCDIKPANLLLDSRLRRILLTDFGLARLPSSAQEDPAEAAGSPPFMAPEQALEPDKVDERTDIYGLGATLYYLLTGHPPQRIGGDGQLGSFRGDLVSPRTLNPAVPADLETVCQHCLHAEPERRYPSATAVADELRRFQEGKDLQRRPVGPLTRTWRLCKRNPLAASLVALLACVMIAGYVVLAAAWKEADMQRRLAEAAARRANAAAVTADKERKKALAAKAAADRHRETAEKEKANALAAATEAERQRLRAEKQTVLADENFDMAWKAVDDLTAFSERDLFQKPGLQPWRRKLLQRAMEYYQRFATARSDDKRLARQVAKAWLRIANANHELGAAADATKGYQKAIELSEKELEQPDLPQGIRMRLVQSLAQARLGLSKSLENQGDKKGALEQAEQAEKLVAPLLEKSPRDLSLRYDLASARYGQARLMPAGTSREELLQRYQAVLTLWEELPKGLQPRPIDLDLIGLAHVGIGGLHGERELKQRFDAYDKAQKVFAQLRRKEPYSPIYMDHHATALERLSDMASELGVRPLDAELAKLAQQLRGRLASENPTVADYQHRWAASLLRLGDRYDDHHRNKEMLAAYQKAASILASLSAKHPENVDHGRQHARAVRKTGYALRVLGKPREALNELNRAESLLKPLLAKFPNDPLYKIESGYLLSNRASAYLDLGKTAEALRDAMAALAIRIELADAEPESISRRRDVLKSQMELADVYRRRYRALRNKADGTRYFEYVARAVRTLEQLKKSKAFRIKDQEREATLYINVGLDAIKGRRIADAKKWIEKGLKAFREVQKRHARPRNALQVAVALVSLAKAFHDEEDYKEADRYFENATATATKVVAANADDHAARNTLAVILFIHSDSRLKAGEPAQAEKLLAKAEEHARRLVHDAPSMTGYGDTLASVLERKIHFAAQKKDLALVERSYYDARALYQKQGQKQGRDLYFLARRMAEAIPPLEQAAGNQTAHLKRWVIDTLREARAAGYPLKRKQLEDERFDSVREQPGFQELFADVAAK